MIARLVLVKVISRYNYISQHGYNRIAKQLKHKFKD